MTTTERFLGTANEPEQQNPRVPEGRSQHEAEGDATRHQHAGLTQGQGPGKQQGHLQPRGHSEGGKGAQGDGPVGADHHPTHTAGAAAGMGPDGRCTATTKTPISCDALLPHHVNHVQLAHSVSVQELPRGAGSNTQTNSRLEHAASLTVRGASKLPIPQAAYFIALHFL